MDIRNWRGIFLNILIKQLGFKSYLELGIAVGECWQFIELEDKVGIDTRVQIDDPRVLCSTTDNFFNSNNKKFDLIYIDADHSRNQVEKDFFNSLNALTENGIIVMHDINPLEEWHIDKNGAGDCFRFWMDLVENYPDHLKTFVAFPDELEGSFGIFFQKGTLPEFKKNPEDQPYEVFDTQRQKFVADFKVDLQTLIADYKRFYGTV